jgi:predicted DNA-binding transcriptional regulator YafY
VASRRRWYLIAYDSERGDWRIFRVDRIRDPHRTGVRTPPRALPTEDAAAYLTGKLYDRAPTYQAVVTLHAPAREVTVQLGDAYGERDLAGRIDRAVVRR